jgi:Tfp pilus assembly protein PilO
VTSNERTSIVLVVIAGIAILAALWLLAIGPKRSENAKVRDNVSAQQQRLDEAQSELASYQAARKQFPGMLDELRALDKAVPARGAISSLLRQVQRRADARGSELRLVALKAAAAVPAAGTTAAPITPGATVGPDGLSALPFTFEFSGRYFDLRDILQTIRRSVSVRSGDVKVAGRLLTIDGVSFTRDDPDSPLTKAVVNATAYIAPDGAATPQAPAAAAGAPTAGGS